MWLVADSGSTKTAWVLFNANGIKEQIVSSGLNPLFLSESEFKSKLKEIIPAEWANNVTKVWFYGAGCGSDVVKLTTKSWLKATFIKATIEIDSDLLAAARATCGNNKGIVAILGTGSNSCYYDGKDIVQHVKPLGFILGDEGSGAALGKSLLKKLLRNQFSANLTSTIYKNLGMDYDKIIHRVYHSDWPNRFIASCSRVLHTHKNEPEIGKIITSEFGRFVEILQSYNLQLEINCVGSIAFYFKPYLEKSLKDAGLNIGAVLQAPAEELVQYHLKNS